VNGWHRKRSTRRADIGASGFALPELLVVIVILGLLAAGAVFAARHVRESAVQSVCETDRRTVDRATQVWMQSNPATPTMDDLVDTGLLRNPSQLHTIGAAGDAVARPDGECGSLGGPLEAALAGDGGGPQGAGGGGSSPAPAGGDGDSPAPAGGDGDSPAPAGGDGNPQSPAGGDGSQAPGDSLPAGQAIEFTLTWTGNADLDVWVQGPSGELVNWASAGASGALLDFDIVPPSPDAVGPHVERVVWPADLAMQGNYTAWAQFQSAGWGAQDGATYVLTLRSGDEVVATTTGPIGELGTQSNPLLAEITA
jgi:prepilin-type N-terminal cleavage/methylation domain-containing protein